MKQNDIVLLNITHEFGMVDDDSMSHLGMRAFKRSGIETLTIRFTRRTNNDTSNRDFLG